MASVFPLYSPPDTGGTHASERDTNVTMDNKTKYDNVVYATPAQTVNIPHQAAASGEQYAVSSKAVSKSSEQQLPREHVDAPDTKKDFQGVSASNYVAIYMYVCASAWIPDQRFMFLLTC